MSALATLAPLVAGGVLLFALAEITYDLWRARRRIGQALRGGDHA